MCINSSAVGQEGAVDIIMELAKKKQEWKKAEIKLLHKTYRIL